MEAMQRALAVLSLVVLGVLPAAAAEIYCNAQGRECGDRPTASANIARVLGGNTAVSRARTGDGAGAAGAAGAGNAGTGSSGEAAAEGGTKADPVAEQQRRNAAQEAATKALQKDLTDTRSEQCRKAQSYYKQALEAATIYRVDKDGKRLPLSEEEANRSRLNAKMEIDRTCSKGGG
jgi:hypothetical protein